MAHCPATLRYCIDDLCRWSGCFKLHGESILTKCNGCGKLVALDGSNNDDCECDPSEDYDGEPFCIGDDE